MASNIRITFMGTGGSWPSPGRGLPAVAVQIDDITNLLDCGEGTQKQIMKSKLSFMSIHNIFITHFHGGNRMVIPHGAHSEFVEIVRLAKFKFTNTDLVAEAEVTNIQCIGKDPCCAPGAKDVKGLVSPVE